MYFQIWVTLGILQINLTVVLELKEEFKFTSPSGKSCEFGFFYPQLNIVFEYKVTHDF